MQKEAFEMEGQPEGMEGLVRRHQFWKHEVHPPLEGYSSLELKADALMYSFNFV